MTSTDEKVGSLPASKWDNASPEEVASAVEAAFAVLDGRWKMIIIFQLFDHPVMRFSDLEKNIPGISQKMLIQQLREMERDGIVSRKAYAEMPPRVEYRLTPWGLAMCPALEGILAWAEQRPAAPSATAD